MLKSLIKLFIVPLAFSLNIHAQWINTGFAGENVSDVHAKDKTLYAASRFNLYSSPNNGETWDSLSSFDFLNLRISTLDNLIFVYSSWAVAGFPILMPCVFRSADGGHSWNSVLSGYYGTSSLVNNGKALFCIISNVLLKSTDNGISWDTVEAKPPHPGSYDYLFSYKGVLYTSEYQTGIFKSADDGLNWENITGSLPSIGYTQMSANNKYIFAEADSLIYRSSDEGKSWKTINITQAPIISIFKILTTDDLIFITGKSRDSNYTTKVYAGTVESNNWRDISAGLPQTVYFSPKSFAVKDNYLYLASSHGLLKYNYSQLLGVEDQVARIEDYELFQNYPNPFNPATTISYSLPKNSYVELRISDILGREVSTLVSKEQNAGEYKIHFNASSLPSGLYIYTIQAGHFRDSKKLLLLK